MSERKRRVNKLQNEADKTALIEMLRGFISGDAFSEDFRKNPYHSDYLQLLGNILNLPNVQISTRDDNAAVVNFENFSPRIFNVRFPGVETKFLSEYLSRRPTSGLNLDFMGWDSVGSYYYTFSCPLKTLTCIGFSGGTGYGTNDPIRSTRYLHDQSIPHNTLVSYLSRIRTYTPFY